MRKLYSSGSAWEQTIGYSRAVQIGNTLHVSPTAATGPEGKVVGEDVYAQTRFLLKKIEAVLQEAGFTLADVVQSRMYVTNIDTWKEAGRAHGEVFGEIRPAFALLHVLPFVDPAMLVEVEVTAVKQ